MKKIKIFNYPWHVGHQYELCKIPNTEWFYMQRTNRGQWDETKRPKPNNVKYVDSYEPGKYDLAILHIDQECFFKRQKGEAYYNLNKQIKDIPKIVINHGTPYYGMQKKEELQRLMREWIGDNVMVVNSMEAQAEWGFGTPIIHGIDPKQWKPAKKKKKRIITTLSRCDNLEGDNWREYYGRDLLNKLKNEFEIVHIGQDITFNSWREYKKYIAESMLYVNMTLHSPMPRSRTEAMMSGVCTISTPYHDWGMYIQSGVNGYIVENTKQVIDRIKDLMKKPALAKKIGLEGRKTAMKQFNTDRFTKTWEQLIDNVLKNYIQNEAVRDLKKEVYNIIDFVVDSNLENKVNIAKGFTDSAIFKVNKLIEKK